LANKDGICILLNQRYPVTNGDFFEAEMLL